VRDLDRVVEAARKTGVQIVTSSLAPVQLRATARGARAILLRDPDGYFVEGEDVSSSAEPPSTENVQSAGMRFAMADREAANAVSLRVQDPGAPMMSLRVKDLEGLLKRLRAAGVPVLSSGDEVVQFTPTTRNVLVEDPNGIQIELHEQR
jgi:hypothetical protein